MDLADGRVEVFDFRVVDAAYIDANTLLAVVRRADRLQLVEIRDEDPTELHPIELPTPVDIAWPWGGRFRDSKSDWNQHATIRIGASPHGIVVAQDNGLLAVRWPGGRWDAWRIEPASDGWISAFCHAAGVVVTSAHAGRYGEVVFLDTWGRWYDTAAQGIASIGPCIPLGDRFVVGRDDEVLVYEGIPRRVVTKSHVGGRATDASINEGGRSATLAFGQRLVVIDEFTQEALTHLPDGTTEMLVWRSVATPSREPAPSWSAHDDADLGRVWKPDARTIEYALRRVRSEPDILPNLPPDEESAAFAFLNRHVVKPLAPSSVLSLMKRVSPGPDQEPDAFLRFVLRSALPKAWAHASFTAPFDAWLTANVPMLRSTASTYQRHEQEDPWGHFDGVAVREAELTANLTDTPPWCVRGVLTNGRKFTFRFGGSCAALALSTQDADEHAFEWVDEDGELDVFIDPIGGFAYAIEINAEEGELRSGALWRPAELPTRDALRRLYYNANADGLFVGRRAGKWVVDLNADGMEHAEPTSRPTPRAEAHALIARLVEDGQLELLRDADDGLAWAVEAAALGPRELERAAMALEKALVAHPDVDELFADTDQLKTAIRDLRSRMRSS